MDHSVECIFPHDTFSTIRTTTTATTRRMSINVKLTDGLRSWPTPGRSDPNKDTRVNCTNRSTTCINTSNIARLCVDCFVNAVVERLSAALGTVALRKDWSDSRAGWERLETRHRALQQVGDLWPRASVLLVMPWIRDVTRVSHKCATSFLGFFLRVSC